MTNTATPLALPSLDHVGVVVQDLDAAATNFKRRWGAQLTDISETTISDALCHGRPVVVAFRSGVIDTGGCRLELTQPLSGSLFSDFLAHRKGDGVHHLAYVVDDIARYLAWLRPTRAELVMDATLPNHGGRVVYVDGFAHGPTIELIQQAARDTK